MRSDGRREFFVLCRWGHFNFVRFGADVFVRGGEE